MSVDGNKKERVSIGNRDRFSDPLSEDPRPSILRKTPAGASLRLTRLSSLIQNYSSFAGSARTSSVLNTSPIMEDINKIQEMLKTNMPHTSNEALPPGWEPYMHAGHLMGPMHDDLEKNIDGPSQEWRYSEMDRYKFIGEMSLKKLQADTLKKLKIVYNVHKSLAPEMSDRGLEFSPFGWTLEDFVLRRNENGTMWVDTLLNYGEKDLEMVKFKYDMEELFKILSLVFEATKVSFSGENRTVLTFVQDVFEFLRFPMVLKAEAKRNMEKLHDQVNTYLDMLNFRRGSEEEAYKRILDERLMDLAVLGPIELRYEVNWMTTKVDQTILRMTQEIDDLEQQIYDTNMEQNKEIYCSRSALDMYYYEIETYKRRIAELSHRFEQELELIENEISYKTISLDKLHDQRKFLEEQIVIFDEEVRQILQKEIDEKNAEEERKRAEEQAAQEAALAKARKAKAKAKAKKK